MTTEIDLKKFEKGAYCKSNVQDGLIDMMLGIVFLVPALLDVFHLGDNYILHIYGVLLLVFTTVRRKITIPRMGRVKFGAERKRKLMVVSAVLAASVAALFIVFRMKGGSVFGGLVPIVVAGIIIMVFFFMAYFMENNRFYLYGILLGVTTPLSRILEMRGIIPDRHLLTIVSSTIILTMGVITFSRFLKAYRPLEEGEV
ncbi:MAG: hypothetical protein J7M24_05265 [Candidatus Latescibacteria bacterium]|nr:hypothetical protein [Candidatus Latescibacterota bacterium]